MSVSLLCSHANFNGCLFFLHLTTSSFNSSLIFCHTYFLLAHFPLSGGLPTYFLTFRLKHLICAVILQSVILHFSVFFKSSYN